MPQFRVIIVGAGPARLTLAHSLSLAGIEYVLIDRRHGNSAQVGSGLGIYPHCARLLDQFGLLNKALDLAPRMVSWKEVGPGDEVYRTNAFWKDLEEE